MNPFSEKKSILDSINSLIRPGFKKAKADEEKIYKCKNCENKYTKAILRENHFVCPGCGYYGKLSARTRISTIADKNSFREFSRGVVAENPLDFPEYDEKLKEAGKKNRPKGSCNNGNLYY